jgi:hypothetical protein
METYIRNIKISDVEKSLSKENPIINLQILLTQNIEDIGIYNDVGPEIRSNDITIENDKK